MIISKGTKSYIKDTVPSGPSGGGLLGKASLNKGGRTSKPGLSRDGYHIFLAQAKRQWSQEAWKIQPPFCFEHPRHTLFKSGD